MKKLSLGLVTAILLLASATSMTALGAEKKPKARKPGQYALFDTSLGSFVCQLYDKATPNAVANFIGLAEGTKEWKNAKGEVMKNTPYYDGTTFHRVIKNFMIQGGDITGSGSFRPVPSVKDEILPMLTFERAGMLAMANSGPDSSSSQFFVTVYPQQRLDGKYTIFGIVTEGYEVVQKINQVEVGPNDKPVQDVVLKKVTIERVTKKGK
jgi:peptidyl-prolyl cis-trans isomerase A (cyclophilin A)